MEQLLPGISASLGVIGGADGPTVIMVAGPDDRSAVLILAALLAAVVLGVVLCVRRKK